jgi:ryanodine receptor 2
MADEDITEFVKNQLILPVKIDPADELSWQHHLYSTLGNKKPSQVSEMKKEALDLLVQRIVALGRVLFGLHMVKNASHCNCKKTAVLLESSFKHFM